MAAVRRNGEDADGGGFWAHQRELRDAGRQLGRAARTACEDVSEVCRRQLDRNPYLTLGSIFGIGYVLGGGIPAGAVRLALGIGLRVGATVAVRELAERARAPRLGGRRRGDGSAPAPARA